MTSPLTLFRLSVLKQFEALPFKRKLQGRRGLINSSLWRVMGQIVVLLLVALAVVGCTSLSTTAMVPDLKHVATPRKETLLLGPVGAGEIKTDPLYRSIADSGTVDPPEFTAALRETMLRSGMFSGVTDSGPAEFRLDAVLVSQEMITGYPMIATLLVRYELTDQRSGELVWTKDIFSVGQSPAAEAFEDRQKLANERAVKENMARLLDELADIL